VGGGVYWRRWQRQIAESISASRQRAAMCSLLVACGGVRRSWFVVFMLEEFGIAAAAC